MVRRGFYFLHLGEAWILRSFSGTWFIMEWSCRFPSPFYFMMYKSSTASFIRMGRAGESLDVAVDFFEMRKDVPFHRALEDAEYTGRIFARFDFEQVKEYISVDYYRPPQTKEEEFTLEFPGMFKFVSRTFPTREKAMEDKNVTDMLCVRCRRMLKRRSAGFLTGSGFNLCLGRLSGAWFCKRQDPH